MRERATVIRTNENLAEIEVNKASMCERCEKNGDCSHHCEISGLIGGTKKMKTVAQNRIGAKAGDLVEIETESIMVLGYAALVFIMPILICALFYYVANLIAENNIYSLISAAAGFFISFAAIALVDRLKKGKTPDIMIVKVIKRAGE